MAHKEELNIYELMKDWFDFCFENPELVNPNHSAMYFFILGHCNRLGWKQKFGLPMQMTMDAIGIKNYRTFSNTFKDLINWGFILLLQKSVNQYSANVIGLVKNTKANTKALSKATQTHSQKQVRGIVGITKPITNIQNTNLLEGEKEKTPPPENPVFDNFMKKFEIPISECKVLFLSDELHIHRLKKQYGDDIPQWINKFFAQLELEGIETKTLIDAKSHFTRWYQIKSKEKTNENSRRNLDTTKSHASEAL